MVKDLADYLRASGHRVDLYWGTRRESQYRVAPDGRTYRMRTPRLKALEGYGLTEVDTFAIRALIPLLVHAYDVVHAFTPTAALASAIAGHRTVYTVLGHPSPASLSPRRLQRSAFTRAIDWSTEVVALSASAAAAVASTFGRVPSVLPPGIYVDRYEPKPKVLDGPARLLFSGALSNQDKGLLLLLRAFGRLLLKQRDARLWLSGPGGPRWALRELGADADRIVESIEVLGTGSVADIPVRYRSADVTVLPSRDEAFGIVLVESLASGTPVVGGKPGGAEDIIDDQIGRLVAYGDEDGLVQALEECIALARDPGAIARCVSAARRWDWSAIGPRYETLYANVCGPRRPPGYKLWNEARVRWGARAKRSVAHPSAP